LQKEVKLLLRKNVYLIIALLITISAFSVFYFYSISYKNTDLNALKKELMDLKMNSITITNEEMETEKEITSGESLIDDESFKWVSIKEWDMIKVINPITKDKVEIKDTVFISGFNLHDMLFPLTYRFSPSDIVPHKVQPYIYEFIKDNKTYSLRVVRNDLIKIDDKYYSTHFDIEGLGDAFLPSPTYLEVNNIFAKIYYSGMYKFNKDNYNFDKRHINLFAQYFSEGHLEILKSFPQEDIKLSVTLTFYWHNEEIVLYLYENNNKSQYIKLKDNKNTYYFKQTDSSYSILNIMGL
jgi:hypothetical protein